MSETELAPLTEQELERYRFLDRLCSGSDRLDNYEATPVESREHGEMVKRLRCPRCRKRDRAIVAHDPGDGKTHECTARWCSSCMAAP